jgi:hypothetical protein
MNASLGIATVLVAASGVSPLAPARAHANYLVRYWHVRFGRRDADQCARDARDP